jgi:uncharacterized membrane protein
VPPNPHPLIVHFPIALLTIFTICEIAARVSGRETLRSTAYWNLVFGTVFAAIAVASGLFAEELVPKQGAAHDTLETHESLAFATLGIFAALFLWRVLREGTYYRKFSKLFLMATLIAWAALAVASYYGGELVYRHGIGISQPAVTDRN